MTQPKLIPTEKQLRFLDWEFGVFFHFGIRSFFLNHDDWDGKEMPASAFNPDRLDCRQWVQVAKDMGAAYTILTCKHHDGFANWPTAYSDYSVAHTPWRGGKGDVVREYVDACRALDIKVGLYYSPAQWQGGTPFSDDAAYDDYFIHQITELLTNYGKIDYLWFDGCGSEHHEYDRDRIVRTIRSLQPEILIFEMWDPDTRWVGNEAGYAPMPNPNTVTGLDFSVMTTTQRSLGGARFLPAECDCMLRNTWFDCRENEDTIKSVDQLVGMYELSVGHGANLLLNIGPNRHGLLNDADVARVQEFGAALRRRYGTPLPFEAVRPYESAHETAPNTVCIRMPHWVEDAPYKGDSGAETRAVNAMVDTVVLAEDLTAGESVQEFRIYANLPQFPRSKRICVYHGDTIGHKCICRFPAMYTGQLSVEVLRSNGDWRIASMQAFYTAGEKA